MTTVWAGLSVGAVYALVALGLNIVYVASATFNFAQAQFVMLGTMLAYVGLVERGWPLPVTMLAAGGVGLVAGALEERVAIRPIAGRGVHGELVTTVGAAAVIEGIALRIWGVEARRVPDFVSGRTVTVLGGRVDVDELVLIGVAVLLTVVLVVWSRRTMIGLASLATAEDREAAMLRGIDVRRLSMGSVAVAAAIATALGSLVATKTFATTGLGHLLIIKSFLVLAIGGFGSYGGVIVGAFAVGLFELYVGRELGSGYVNLALFGLLMAVLLARPQGLFGRRLERPV